MKDNVSGINASEVMRFKRIWAMPNTDTFNITPIKQLIHKHIDKNKVWIDPFARDGIFKSSCKYTNDLNAEFKCTHNMDAHEFLKTFENESVDGILFDPPYSFHQVVVSYNGYGDKRVHQITPCLNEIARILKPNGVVMHFGWNSNGCGKGRGLEITEILLLAHGGGHNDTIVTVERKFVKSLF